MPEEGQATPPQEPQGIFEPKEFHPEGMPRSGKEKAKRLMIAVGAVLLVLLAFMLLKDPFMRPAKTFFKGLTAHDTEMMASAFPAWLAQKTDDDKDAVTQMCETMQSAAEIYYGKNASYKASLNTKTAISQERLDKLAEGIKTAYGVNVKITKGWNAKLVIGVKNGSSEQSFVQYVKIYRINGRWVMIDVPSDSE